MPPEVEAFLFGEIMNTDLLSAISKDVSGELSHILIQQNNICNLVAIDENNFAFVDIQNQIEMDSFIKEQFAGVYLLDLKIDNKSIGTTLRQLASFAALPTRNLSIKSDKENGDIFGPVREWPDSLLISKQNSSILDEVKDLYKNPDAPWDINIIDCDWLDDIILYSKYKISKFNYALTHRILKDGSIRVFTKLKYGNENALSYNSAKMVV